MLTERLEPRGRGGEPLAGVQPDPLPAGHPAGLWLLRSQAPRPSAQPAALRRPCRQRAQACAPVTGSPPVPGMALSAPGSRWACGLHLACPGLLNTALESQPRLSGLLEPLPGILELGQGVEVSTLPTHHRTGVA